MTLIKGSQKQRHHLHQRSGANQRRTGGHPAAAYGHQLANRGWQRFLVGEGNYNYNEQKTSRQVNVQHGKDYLAYFGLER